MVNERIFDEDKMKQTPLYPTKQTPSYADWALFNMGKELEGNTPPTPTAEDVGKVVIVGEDGKLMYGEGGGSGGVTIHRYTSADDFIKDLFEHEDAMFIHELGNGSEICRRSLTGSSRHSFYFKNRSYLGGNLSSQIGYTDKLSTINVSISNNIVRYSGNVSLAYKFTSTDGFEVVTASGDDIDSFKGELYSHCALLY